MHGRRRFAVAIGIASMGAGAWMGRGHLEQALLPRLPMHAACLDHLGGWADLARGTLPSPDCPAPAGWCEPALLLLNDEALPLPARIVARAHAEAARCPVPPLALEAVTRSPRGRRQAGLSDPWAAEAIAVHGLWPDAVSARAVLGDSDALDLLADLIALDPLYRPAALDALGASVRVDGTLPDDDSLGRALQIAAGRPERGPNAPPPLAGLPTDAPDRLDALTGSGDATHALLAEGAAVRAWIGGDAARLEAALFSPLSGGSAPGDVHGAFVAGGGSAGATSLAAELAWGPLTAAWDPSGVQLRAGESAWWLDSCRAPRRATAGDPEGTPVPPLQLALAERVGAALRAGDVEAARDADAALTALLPPGGPRPAWASPPLAALLPAASPALPAASPALPVAASPALPDAAGAAGRTLTPPWLTPPPPRGRGRRPPALPPPASAPSPRDVADAIAATLSVDTTALAAWAAWRTHDDELARQLLRDPPTALWPRYAWRTVATALGEPSTAPVRPSGCAPPLWAGPV